VVFSEIGDNPSLGTADQISAKPVVVWPQTRPSDIRVTRPATG
jgi:hypothetical protein